jgi:hypothetical protein
VLNPEGSMLDLESAAIGRVTTDGRAAYLELEGNRLCRALVVQGTSLVVGAKQSFRSADRRDFETSE